MEDEWYYDDSEPVPFGTACEAKSPEGFLCCLEVDHEGQHEAMIPWRSKVTGKFRVLAVWR